MQCHGGRLSAMGDIGTTFAPQSAPNFGSDSLLVQLLTLRR